MKDVSRLGLEEKIGQLFCLGFHGHEPDRDTRELLEIIRPGGIVLSRRNIETFDQTTRLTARFVEGRDIPSLVAISQEGGAADRLRHIEVLAHNCRPAVTTRCSVRYLIWQLRSRSFRDEPSRPPLPRSPVPGAR